MNPTPLEQIAKFAGAEIFSGDGKVLDRKSTRLNSSHSQISYAVFCLKKKTMHDTLGCDICRIGASGVQIPVRAVARHFACRGCELLAPSTLLRLIATTVLHLL